MSCYPLVFELGPVLSLTQQHPLFQVSEAVKQHILVKKQNKTVKLFSEQTFLK